MDKGRQNTYVYTCGVSLEGINDGHVGFVMGE